MKPSKSGWIGYVANSELLDYLLLNTLKNTNTGQQSSEATVGGL